MRLVEISIPIHVSLSSSVAFAPSAIAITTAVGSTSTAKHVGSVGFELRRRHSYCIGMRDGSNLAWHSVVWITGTGKQRLASGMLR